MQENVNNSPDHLLKALVEAPEFVQLESALGQFNLFETLRAERAELRHSDFLAALLNPRGSHGLKTLPVEEFLREALANSENFPGLFKRMEEIEVHREFANIDILLVHQPARIAVIIENKIDTGEHSGQLGRYYDYIVRNFQGYRIVAFYLTVNREAPSDSRYIAISYDDVYAAINRVIKKAKPDLGSDVEVVLRHYTQILERHFVADSNLHELCGKIHREHKRAVEMLFETRTGPWERIRGLLQGLIAQGEDLVPEESTLKYIRFIPGDVDRAVPKQGTELKSKRILWFEFQNHNDSLTLILNLAPGLQELRKKIYACMPGKQLDESDIRYKIVFQRPFLTRYDYEADDENLKTKIENIWAEFVAKDLPEIRRQILECFSDNHQ